MRSLEEPDAPRGRGLLWILLVAALGSALAWYAVSRATPPSAPSAAPPTTARTEVPTSRNERPSKTERPSPDRDGGPPSSGRADRTTPPPPRSPAPASRPETAVREFRVTSDVPGAYVFLDRKFLGTTPFTSREVAAGTHQVNVQLEGRPPVVRTVNVLAEGLTDVEVTLPPAEKTAAAINANVAVVHNHAVGSCEGTLRASGDGFRYDTPHKDAFSLPFASVETFAVDYAEKRLRLKQRGGRTWNFTTRAATADPLFVFHRDVAAARP